jgi:hypothetical protein
MLEQTNGAAKSNIERQGERGRQVKKGARPGEIVEEEEEKKADEGGKHCARHGRV